MRTDLDRPVSVVRYGDMLKLMQWLATDISEYPPSGIPGKTAQKYLEAQLGAPRVSDAMHCPDMS